MALTEIPSTQAEDQKDEFDRMRALFSTDNTDKYAFLNSAYSESRTVDRLSSVATTAPNSLVNRYSLFTWYGLHGSPGEVIQYYTDQANNALAPTISKKPEIANIIHYFSEKHGGIEYTWSDFLWAKYNKKIPNNYMLTLRRFSQPCEDNIFGNIKSGADTTEENPESATYDFTQPDVARAITWMSEETGNKMEDILSFGYGYNWKEHKSEMTTQQSTEGGYTAQPFYSKFGAPGKALLDLMKGIGVEEKAKKMRESGHDPLTDTYENFVIGPVNVIDNMQTRDRGLNFEHEITVTFEYKLKSYSDLNPKVAFLDIFANLLVLTFSNASFWGGANRFFGGEGYVASRFGDVEKLVNGDYKGYLESAVTEIGGGFRSLVSNPNGEFDPAVARESFSGFANNLMGQAMGGFIDKFMGAAPSYQAVKGLITGESTGNWHLTIGNPLNPIAMFGNLICTNSKITFGNVLSNDDFPTELKLEVTLKHARPRDKSDFESAFNAGKGRLYAAPEDMGDVLNIEGLDVDVYGAFQGDEVTNVGEHGGDSAEDNFDLDYQEKIKGFEKWASDKSNVVETINKIIHL